MLLVNLASILWQSQQKSILYTYEAPDLMSILFMDQDENVLAFWPYRQLYLDFLVTF